jgi:uncharacterized membrane protein YgcG
VSEYLSDTPVVSVRQPFRRRTVRLAARAFVRLMSAGASAKEKARIAKDTADNNDEVLAFAAKQTFQKQSEETQRARLHVTGVAISVFVSIVFVSFCSCLVFSGLVSKLDLRSFKLTFLEHTSDVLIRSRKEQTARNNAARPAQDVRTKRLQARFNAWLKRRTAELAPLPDEDSSAGALLNSLVFDGYPGDEDGVGEGGAGGGDGSGGVGGAGGDGEGGAGGDSNVAEALMAAGLEAAAAGMDEQEGDAMDEGEAEEADEDEQQVSA